MIKNNGNENNRQNYDFRLIPDWYWDEEEE